MASKNVQTALAVYENFNKRDIDGAVSGLAEDLVFEDHGFGQTYKSRAEFRDSMQSWVDGFSDVKVTTAKTIDAGDTVILQLEGNGKNDGPMGPFTKPTGRSITVPFVELYKFDASGRIVAGETYFDMLTLLVQLGHAERPAQPAAARS
jgi:steroid delta-isomerase-like uncharacterized protein